MKTNLFLFAALITAFLSGASFSAAQVTIGGSAEPTKGAILDLNSTTKGGLLLSNVELTSLTAIPASFPNASAISNPQLLAGMMVYNLNDFLTPNGDGLYAWDGNKWNYIGGSDGQALLPPPPSVTISAPTTCLNPVPDVIVSQYNLGADTTKFNSGEYATLSHAKRQIRYLKDCTPANAVNVFGDLYQWGRVADGHEKRTSESFATNDNSMQNGAITDVDVYGQATAASGAVGKFIKQKDTPYDWRATQQNNLWGNGEGFNPQSDDNGGVLYTDSKYYQNTDWAIRENNPCPSGWRVPTLDEWKRLVSYNCNPTTYSGGDISNMISTGKTTTGRGSGNELTWVPVAGGKADNSGWANTKGHLSGYAVYKTTDWDDAAAANYKNGTKNLYDAAAPEPLFFLPAGGLRQYFDSSFYSVGQFGFYWSTTIYNIGVGAGALFFTYDYVHPSGGLLLADAASVRCVK
ncbi:MAG: hypothetical protein LBS01_10890 [Prevotellaceae bacterium]|nr:hypothetical protein [Prevotellaceae bacterium]